jgi:hypothetical protein
MGCKGPFPPGPQVLSGLSVGKTGLVLELRVTPGAAMYWV